MSDLSTADYPLGENASGELRAASNRPLADITLDAVAQEQINNADLQIRADTLRQQATIALKAGYVQLSQNLNRAAELTAVPNEELVRMYETLRPGRATYEQMLALADLLAERYAAAESAKLVREASQAYLARGLVKREG